MDDSPAVAGTATFELWRRDARTGSAFVTVSTAANIMGLFSTRPPCSLIGFNIGVLIQTAPQMFGEIMGELFVLIAAGVLSPGQPTVYKLADGSKARAALETRASVGKLALQP